jgi:hypothetical protein
LRSTRIAVSITLSIAIVGGLSGCGILPSPIDLLGGGGARGAAPEGPVEAGSCLDTITGRAADPADLVACTTGHSADVVGFVEWPGMADLVTAEGAQHVWDQLSGNYAQLDSAPEYNLWVARACGDALREFIGWDGLEVGGRSASELDLRPGGIYDVVAALGDEEAFLDGDKRTRCVLSWYEPVAYEPGTTAAAIATSEFPIVARDCYTADDEGYLNPEYCSKGHTDQVVVSFDGIATYGIDGVRLPEDYTTEELQNADLFCEDAVVAVLGPDIGDHYAWSTTLYSDDWAALTGEPAPDGSYPFGCLLSTYDGLERGDVFAAG